MARIPKAILDGIHGRLGKYVFKRINGKTFLCKMPVFKKRRKPSAGEMIQREKFAFLVCVLKPLKALIREIYKHVSLGKIPFNKAFEDNYHEIINGDYPHFKANYSRLVLSRGSLELPEFILAASILPGALTFIWTYDNYFLQNAKMFWAVYCEELNQWKFEKGETVILDCMCTLELPDFCGKPVHTYIGFVSEHGTEISNSYYTGMVNIL